MSTQVNQYLMYGISVPYIKGDDFYNKYEDFMDDSAFNDNIPAGPDGIFCLMDGMNGNYMVIGKVLAKSDNYERIADDNPLRICTLTPDERIEIINAITKHFGDIITERIGAEYYLITHYR